MEVSDGEGEKKKKEEKKKRREKRRAHSNASFDSFQCFLCVPATLQRFRMTSSTIYAGEKQQKNARKRRRRREKERKRMEASRKKWKHYFFAWSVFLFCCFSARGKTIKRPNLLCRSGATSSSFVGRDERVGGATAAARGDDEGGGGGLGIGVEFKWSFSFAFSGVLSRSPFRGCSCSCSRQESRDEKREIERENERKK